MYGFYLPTTTSNSHHHLQLLHHGFYPLTSSYTCVTATKPIVNVITNGGKWFSRSRPLHLYLFMSFNSFFIYLIQNLEINRMCKKSAEITLFFWYFGSRKTWLSTFKESLFLEDKSQFDTHAEAFLYFFLFSTLSDFHTCSCHLIKW